MSSTRPTRPLTPRHVQLGRAIAAAIAAAMVTFSSDHSAPLGLAVFSGFAIFTALVLFLSAALVFRRGHRAAIITLAAFDLVAGMIAGVGAWRTETMFFALVASWAVVTGITEIVPGIRARRATDASAQARADGRDAVVIGALGVLLAIGLMLVPAGYALHYTVEAAHESFTLTGITIGVGLFGAYAALVAVYLGIAGFSPRTADDDAAALGRSAASRDATATDITAGSAASDSSTGGAA